MKIYIKYKLKSKSIEFRPIYTYTLECKAYYNKPEKFICDLKREYSIPVLIDDNYDKSRWSPYNSYNNQEESEMIKDFLSKMNSNIEYLLRFFIKDIKSDTMVDEGYVLLKNEYLKGYRTLEIEIGDK